MNVDIPALYLISEEKLSVFVIDYDVTCGFFKSCQWRLKWCLQLLLLLKSRIGWVMIELEGAIICETIDPEFS